MSSITKLILTFVIFFNTESLADIRVCNTFEDYSIPFNKNCWEVDYENKNVSGIAASWGFKTEEYSLTLEDGYIITVFRVFENVTKQHPVVLGPGAASNTRCFAIEGNNSLAYLFGKRGFDVWLVNWRGTEYSLKHTFKANSNDYFNNFTFHEMGIYDLKATMDLVFNTTKKKAVYIGHSQGTTISYVYCSVLPEHCESRLIGVISLAPVAVLKNVKGFLNLVWTSPIWTVLRSIFQFTGAVIPVPAAVNPVAIPLSLTPTGIYIFFTLAGTGITIDLESVDPKSAPIIMRRAFDNIGVQTWTHYSQIYNSGKFSYFDYGSQINFEKYGSEEPPEYPLLKIPVPIVLYAATPSDIIASNETAEFIYSNLNSTSRCGYYVINSTLYTHLDFLSHKLNPTLLHKSLLEKIDQLEDGKCIA